MMVLAALAYSGILVVSGPSGEPLVGPQEKANIRCRPAPYYIVEKGEQRLKPQRTVLTGTRVPIRRFYAPERRARPCHLMHAPSPPSGFNFIKIADE